MSIAKRIIGGGSEFQRMYGRLLDSGMSRSQVGAEVGKAKARAARVTRANIGAAPVQVVLTGVVELDELFKTLPEKMQKKALRPACRDVAKMVLAQAKSEVPEDTGLLQSELRVKAKKRSRKYPQTVGMTVGFRDDLFKGDTFYAGFMEFGTEERQQKKSGRRAGKIDETRFAFLRPALWSYPEKKLAVFQARLKTWLFSQKAV